MDKLNMQTPNTADENFEKLAAMFPNAVTETIDENGNVVRAIDKDMLMQEISCKVVEGREERYQFTWPDKKKAVLLANSPINATLRPCKEESVDFDKTKNLYIEGDNLDVLKCLKETYLGKVKMIYIDPPYNTGNDFVYEDDFAESSDEYKANSGQYDEQGNRLVTNAESNGRFHTDWLNMIYPRLKAARDLLTDDGVIFISIGDDENANMIKICDEIFGENNFIANICHKHRASVSNDRIISENHNHILFYSKNIEITFYKQKEIGEDPILDGFNKEDEKGKYKLAPVDGPGGAKKGNPYYDFLGISGYWRYSKETMRKLYDDGLLILTNSNIQKKYYESQAKLSRRTVTTWWDDDFLTSSATSALQKLMGAKTFDNPKNVNLLLRMLKMITHFDKSAIILDFFSGSATTAHAVMQLNAEDGGNRKFIMVQLPEVTDEKSEAYKAGYKNICEIGKERIRRAGKKVISDQWLAISIEEKQEYGCIELSKSECLAEINRRKQTSLFDSEGNAQSEVENTAATQRESVLACPYGHFGNSADVAEREQNAPCPHRATLLCPLTASHLSLTTDIGFRVLKLDSSNMQDVYYAPSEYSQDDLFAKTENVKPDRTSEDLLFHVMLELGATLDSKIEQTTVEGKSIFNVAEGYLVACFDAEIDDKVVTAIAQMHPQYAVFRDCSMIDDSTATNFEQIFRTYSPSTTTKVL